MNSKEDIEKGRKIISKDYISSYDYEVLMFKYLNGDENMYDLAYNSENFEYRLKKLRYLGAWKWMSVFQYRYLIADIVFSDKKGLDFGGWNGPIFGNSVIVDNWEESEHKSLLEFAENSQDYIFSSHTLEHIMNFSLELERMYKILKKKGQLILILPSYMCKKWLVGTGNTHLYNMILSSDEENRKFQENINTRAYYNVYFRKIDKILEKIGFKIIEAEYCWDDSIFILAEK